MNSIKEYHLEFKKDWDFFPFKLDYIIHVLFSNNEKVYDIHFKRNNNFYTLCYINEPNEKNNEFECDNFPINRD